MTTQLEKDVEFVCHVFVQLAKDGNNRVFALDVYDQIRHIQDKVSVMAKVKDKLEEKGLCCMRCMYAQIGIVYLFNGAKF